jgi:hypothetical protein
MDENELASIILDSVEALLPPAPTRASLGGIDPDGNYAVAVSGTPRVYLHNEAAETLDTALNINAPLMPNCPVLLYVVGSARWVTVDVERIEAFMGNSPILNAVGPHTHNDPYGGLYDLVSLKRILNGTLVPKGGMTVKLLSKTYWSDDGTKILSYQQNDTTGIYDITPAAPTAGNRRLVLVGITRSTGVPTHKSGPLKPILSTPSAAELAGVDLSDFEPWRAVNYKYGATSITFEDILDVSPLTSSKYDSFGTSTIKTLSSDKIAASGDRHLIVAAQTGTADNLIEITGLVIGLPVIVRADAGDTITVKYNDAGATDKIMLHNGADLTLTGDKTLELVKIASGKVIQLMGTGDFLRDGSLSMTGDLNLGGNDIMNVASANIDQLVFSASTELTIAAGAVTAGVKTFYTVDTEANAASDDLDTINGGAAGETLILRADNTARTVVVTTAGNIQTPDGASITLDETYKVLWLIYDGTLSKWVVVGTGGSSGMSSFTVRGNSGSDQTISNSNLLDLTGAEGVKVVMSATDKATPQLDVSGLTAESSPDPLADYVPFYDTSASAHRKGLLQNLLLLTTKGDLLTRTTTQAQRLAVGSNGQIVIADSAATPGLRWGGDPILTKPTTTTLGMIVKNTSGATVAEGDVGILVYTTTNGWEYQRTTTASHPNVGDIRVVLLGGANNADIYVAQRGRVTVNTTGTAPAIGDFLVTSTTGGSAQRSTTMQPEIFAVCLAAGSGGTVLAQLLTQSFPVPVKSGVSNIYQVTGYNDSDFRSTISAVTTTTVTYGVVTSGSENVINVLSGSLGKLRLYNETRGTYRLILSVNTATNVITTQTTTDSWANTDVITIRSQTNTAVSGASYFYEIDFSASDDVPLRTRAITAHIVMTDSGAANQSCQIHPYEANNGFKTQTIRNFIAGTDTFSLFEMELRDRKFVVRDAASGVGTRNITLRLVGYELAVE